MKTGETARVAASAEFWDHIAKPSPVGGLVSTTAVIITDPAASVKVEVLVRTRTIWKDVTVG